MLLLVYILVGLAVGSFLNVVIARTRTGEPPTGRSRCLRCGKTLAWYELVPLISFIVQKRRCRSCSATIAWQYPIVEIATALGFAGALILFTTQPFLAGWTAFAWALTVLMVVYDLLHKEIPDNFIWALGAWVAIALVFFWHDTIETHLLAGVGLALFFLLLYALSRGRWIGGGDVKVAVVLGAWAGWPHVLVLFLTAYCVGALIGISLLAAGRAGRQTALPFAPFLLLGTWVAFLWGPALIQWYMTFLT